MKELSRQSRRYKYINPFFKKESVDPDNECQLYGFMFAWSIVYYLLLITIFMVPVMITDFVHYNLHDEHLFSLILFPEYIQRILLPGMVIATGALVCGSIAACMLVVVFSFLFLLEGIIKGIEFLDNNYDLPSISLQPITKFFSNFCTPLEIVD